MPTDIGLPNIVGDEHELVVLTLLDHTTTPPVLGGDGSAPTGVTCCAVVAIGMAPDCSRLFAWVSADESKQPSLWAINVAAFPADTIISYFHNPKNTLKIDPRIIIQNPTVSRNSTSACPTFVEFLLPIMGRLRLLERWRLDMCQPACSEMPLSV